MVWHSKFIHLSEEELRALLDHRLNPARESRLKAHLRLCMRCDEQLASLAQAETSTPGAAISAARVWGIVLRALTYQAFRTNQAHHDKPPGIHCLSEDATRGVYFEEVENGDLVIELGSRAEELVSAKYELYLTGHEQYRWRFKFRRRRDGQYLARVVIPLVERQRLPRRAIRWAVRRVQPGNPS